MFKYYNFNFDFHNFLFLIVISNKVTIFARIEYRVFYYLKHIA
ncbi:hypothetical protein M107_1910 [Bacteroides fragilis str. 3725 D9(v)]|nr:hypothetical protein M107_3598 [Bacteroides fragilis str. 3725 D9(v)]EXZ63561.1 hypothetical protein M107_1910 [Bacteroides fragilis str. 3725 D9(v)]